MGCKGSRVRIPPRRPFFLNEINGLQQKCRDPFFFGRSRFGLRGKPRGKPDLTSVDHKVCGVLETPGIKERAWSSAQTPRLPERSAQLSYELRFPHNSAPQASAGLNGVVSSVGRCQLCMMTVHERGMRVTARTQSNDGANDEFGEAEFGDARLTQRLAALARKISQAPHCSFPQALDAGTLKAAYRCFDNPKVDVKGMLEPHIGQTLERIRQLPVVLVPQDTSEFNLTHLPATEGLGLGTGGNRHGFMIHSQLAVSPEGLPLGVLGMKTWVRPAEESG